MPVMRAKGKVEYFLLPLVAKELPCYLSSMETAPFWKEPEHL